jgi:hypothetical protein
VHGAVANGHRRSRRNAAMLGSSNILLQMDVAVIANMLTLMRVKDSDIRRKVNPNFLSHHREWHSDRLSTLARPAVRHLP